MWYRGAEWDESERNGSIEIARLQGENDRLRREVARLKPASPAIGVAVVGVATSDCGITVSRERMLRSDYGDYGPFPALKLPIRNGRLAAARHERRRSGMTATLQESRTVAPRPSLAKLRALRADVVCLKSLTPTERTLMEAYPALLDIAEADDLIFSKATNFIRTWVFQELT